MSETDRPILEELHRQREELFRECGNDPGTLLEYLQEKEGQSKQPVELPRPAASPRPDPRRWDLDRLESTGKEEDRQLAEQGLAGWVVDLDEEDDS